MKHETQGCIVLLWFCRFHLPVFSWSCCQVPWEWPWLVGAGSRGRGQGLDWAFNTNVPGQGLKVHAGGSRKNDALGSEHRPLVSFLPLASHLCGCPVFRGWKSHGPWHPHAARGPPGSGSYLHGGKSCHCEVLDVVPSAAPCHGQWLYQPHSPGGGCRVPLGIQSINGQGEQSASSWPWNKMCRPYTPRGPRVGALPCSHHPGSSQKGREEQEFEACRALLELAASVGFRS